MPTPSLGLVGAGGVSGAYDSLERILQDQLKRKLIEEAKQQREFENRLGLRKQGEVERSARAGEGFEGRRVSEVERAGPAGEAVTTRGQNITRDIGMGNLDQRKYEFEAEAPGREAGVGLQRGQLAELMRRPDAERLGREHDVNIQNIQGRQRLQQIGTEGAQQERMLQLRPQSRLATGEQQTTLRYYNRMRDALADMDAVEDEVPAKDLALINNASWLPDLIKNSTLSSAGRRYAQALQTYTEARLRKESGAAIQPFEYANDRRTISRQVSDDPSTIEQKRGTRNLTAESMAATSGRAYEDWYGEPFKPSGRRSGAKFDVTDPKGKVHSFDTQAQADAFKRLIGGGR